MQQFLCICTCFIACISRPSDTKFTTTTAATGSSNLSFIRAAVKKPPVVTPKEPAKPVTKEEESVTEVVVEETTTKPAADTVTQPAAQPTQPKTVTMPVTKLKTQPTTKVMKPVTKEESSAEPITRETRWQSSKSRTSKEGPTAYSELEFACVFSSLPNCLNGDLVAATHSSVISVSTWYKVGELCSTVLVLLSGIGVDVELYVLQPLSLYHPPAGY